MAINERLIHTAADAAAAVASAEQGLILHLDANDVDSYDGDGSIWYDISEHDVTIPLSDNADDLELHLNASDSTSYDPDTDTTTWTDIVGSNDATMTSMGVANFDKDNGGYFSFDGANDYMTISNDTSFASATNFSVEMWVNPVSIGSDEMLATLYGSSSDQKFDIRFSNSSGNIRFIAGTSSGGFNSGQDLTSASALSTNTWHHIAAVYDDTNDKMFIYIDGELDATKTGASSGTYTSITDPILIGKRTDGFHSNIKLGAFRFYSKALSASEVGQNYRHGRDYIYTGLNGNSDLFLHYDPADTNSYSGTGTTLTDLAGNNNADLLGGIESGWDEELGNSFPMTGSGDGITTSSTVSINPATDGMTIEMWVKVKTDDFNYFFSFDGTHTTGFGLSYRANYDEIWWFYRNSSNNNSIIHSDTIVLNEWTHIVATTNGSSAQFYTNGVLSEETSDNAYSYSYNEDLHFGNLYDLAQNSNSDIGQIRFYKGGLTADEVMQNYLFTKNDYPNGANGTISGATWSADYFDFNGSNDVITLDNSKVSSNTVRSYSCWFNRDGNGYLIANTNGSSYGAHLSIESGNLNAWVYNEAQNAYYTFLNGSHSTTAGTWHHAALTWGENASDCKLYLDGVLKETESSTSGSLLSSAAPDEVRIGRYTSTYFDGKISKVKMYDKILTLSEVTELYNEGSGN